MTEKFIQKGIKRKGALTRLAKHYNAYDYDNQRIEYSKLKRHYPNFTLRQKEEFNLYAHVLRRARA